MKIMGRKNKDGIRVLYLGGLVLIAAAILYFGSSTIYADIRSADTEESSVDYFFINDADELEWYIRRGASPSSHDKLSGKGSYSNTHMIEVEEAGKLIFCPLIYCERYGELIDASYVYIQVYSDYNLRNNILKEKSIRSTRAGFPYISVEPGNYYYRCYQWNGSGDEFKNLNSDVFIGFVPDRKEKNFPLEFDQKDCEINYIKADLPLFENADDFIQNVDESKEAFCHDEIAGVDTPGKAFQINVDESGTLLICPFSEIAKYLKFRVYNDPSLRSCIYSSDFLKNTEGYYYIYLDPGTYYLMAYRWNGHNNTAYAVDMFLGFIPGSSRFNIQSIDYDDVNNEATVTFEVNEEWKDGDIRIMEGYYSGRTCDNEEKWFLDTNDNAIRGNKAIIDENGVYTARLGRSGYTTYLLNFEIDKIGGESEGEETAPLVDMTDIESESSEDEILLQDEPEEEVSELSMEEENELLKRIIEENGITFEDYVN